MTIHQVNFICCHLQREIWHFHSERSKSRPSKVLLERRFSSNLSQVQTDLKINIQNVFIDMFQLIQFESAKLLSSYQGAPDSRIWRLLEFWCNQRRRNVQWTLFIQQHFQILFSKNLSNIAFYVANDFWSSGGNNLDFELRTLKLALLSQCS